MTLPQYIASSTSSEYTIPYHIQIDHPTILEADSNYSVI